MKKRLFLIFILAFVACAAWNFVGDLFSNPAETSNVAQIRKEFWSDPMSHVERRAYPYLHFQEAMDDKLSHIQMYISVSLLPQSLRQAVVATEDKRFYEHGPIDPIGIIRAFVVNAYSGETVQGGSTISQQVVKNVFLSHERTLSRKVQEVVLAFLLEQHYSKDEILEIYLNTAYYGANATGIYEASRTYYGKDPSDLTLPQSAMLAGLLQAPTYYNPLENYEAARNRQQVVLALMSEQGYITPWQATQAYRQDLGLKEK